MNAATLNQDASLSFRKSTPVILPARRQAVEPEATPASRVNGESPEVGAPKQSNRRRNWIVGITALVVTVATGIYYYEFVAPYESTDDAFIAAHVTAVAPQVAGRVAQLLVKDNQEVQPGDVLVQIDPSDYQAKLDQARAALAATRGQFEQANAQFTVDQAKIDQAKANVVAAQADAQQAESDFHRYQAVGDQGISASQLDLAGTKARSAAAQVQAVQNQELAAEAQAKFDQAAIQTATAEVQKNEADVRQAELNLSYTQVKA
ncbi:MAG TPA: biotin/lipoyl-binding protein, partial [Candidatus Paceibacterota bacterium]|nr:biotin/lipoyl-binding protein [Candidatus Paceibacterota bacterium]